MSALIGFCLTAISIIGFASTFIIGSALTKTCGVSPAVLSMLRFAIAGGFLLAFGLSRRKSRQRLFTCTRRDWTRIIWLGPVGTSVMALFVFLGCARVSTANASMADALTPLMIFIVAAFAERHVALRSLLGLTIGFVGALLVIQVIDGHGLALEAYSLGDVYIMLAAATWGVYTVCGKPLIARMGAEAFTTWTMLVGAGLMALALPFGDFVWPATPQAWALVTLLGLVSTLMPFWAWNAAQKHVPTLLLGISAYATPAVAMTLAMVFLGERTTILQWLGTIFILASSVVELKRSAPARRRDPPPTHG